LGASLLISLFLTGICPRWMVLIFFKALSKNRKWNGIPFLLITAEKERDKVIEAVQAGIKENLVKPVDPEKLSDKIKQVVFRGVA
jgi:two-component system, chemotaxis family, chemotaxis protein CheY